MTVDSKEIEVLKKETSPLIEQAQTCIVETSSDVEEASGFLKKISDSLKNIENKRLSFTAPLNQSLNEINLSFRAIRSPLEKARDIVSSKILFWRRKEIERQEKEEERRRKIQEAHAKQGHQVNGPVILERPQNTIGNAQARKIWKFEVINFSQVPDNYKELNQVSVNNAIRAGIKEIAGLRIYQEDILAIK